MCPHSGPPEGVYRVDPSATTIEFHTRHLFGLAGVDGNFKVVSGSITVADPLEWSIVDVVIAADSVSSGSRRRDEMIRSRKFLGADDHPVASYRSTKVTRHGSGWEIEGHLTVGRRGGPVRIVASEMSAGPLALTVRGNARIDRYGLGITAMRGMAGRHLDLDLVLTAVRVEGSSGTGQVPEGLPVR